MRQELDEKLCNEFPEIFKDRHGDMRKTLMCFGFDCGDGWYPVLHILCTAIQRRIDRKDRYFQEIRYSFNKRWLHKLKEIKKLIKKIWYLLISDDNLGEIQIPQVVVSQVKEKFGGLRFYYEGGDEAIDGMVDFAEAMCDETCEYCGSNDDVHQTREGWIKTLCKTCRDAEKILVTQLCKKCADRHKLKRKLRG